MTLAKVITVCDDPEPGVIHSKFAIRRLYVENDLLPALEAAGFSASVFPAVTPKRSAILNGKIHYAGQSLKVNTHGCPNNFMSNFILWQECVERDTTLLICEDDALLTPDAAEVVPPAVEEFASLPDEGDILFLLAQSPSVRGLVRRHPVADAEGVGETMLRLKLSHDLSCTAAYAVRPKAAQALIDRALRIGHDATDSFVHHAFMDGEIGVLIPRDYKRTFMLHEIWEPYCHAPA